MSAPFTDNRRIRRLGQTLPTMGFRRLSGEELAQSEGSAIGSRPLRTPEGVSRDRFLLVERPDALKIDDFRDLYVAHRDVIVNIAERSRFPESRSAPVLDQHESLYLERPFRHRRPFEPGPGSSSHSVASLGGMVSSTGGSRLSPRDQARARPALLLGGHAAVTAFVGRTAELARLRTWFELPAAASAMLVHGAGGQGKTRLTRHFADLMASEGEHVVVRETIPLTEVTVAMVTSEDEPLKHSGGPQPSDLLLLVDEADLWPEPKLLKLLRDMAATGYRRIRVLMTGRSATGWWLSLAANLPDLACGELLLESPSADELRELAIAAAGSHAARPGVGRTAAVARGTMGATAAMPSTERRAAGPGPDARRRGRAAATADAP